MKKLMIFFCSIGALVACSHGNVELQKNEVLMPFEVNEAVEGTVPLRLRISGGVTAKSFAGNPNETTLANVSLKIRCWSSEVNGGVVFEETYQLGNDTDIIINVPECSSADIEVESGAMSEGQYLKTVEGQKEYMYASGTLKVNWAQMQSQELPFEVSLSRLINKITIEKITVDWTNPNNDSKEFRIKKIFLSDVPQTYIENCNTTAVYGYSSAYSGEPQGALFYNFGGLDEFTTIASGTEYKVPSFKVDEMLVDEVDAIVSQDTPYTVPHVFYAYVCNRNMATPKVYTVDSAQGFIKVYPSMTTIVVMAELDGNVMYYRFPICDSEGTAPKNTHMIFGELKITEAGSATMLGSKTYETFSYSFTDWTEDIRTDSVDSL